MHSILRCVKLMSKFTAFSSKYLFLLSVVSTFDIDFIFVCTFVDKYFVYLQKDVRQQSNYPGVKIQEISSKNERLKFIFFDKSPHKQWLYSLCKQTINLHKYHQKVEFVLDVEDFYKIKRSILRML